jgi:hypothetical protein
MMVNNRPNQTIFTFKDSHRYHWRVTTWKARERLSLSEDREPPDFEWAYIIERQDGDWIEVYHSSITGMGDEPVRLRNILDDYLIYTMRAMMDGVHAVADSPMEIISVRPA